MTVFIWSVYNGAVYYIDVFGTRFQKELEKLKQDVAKWQMSPEMTGKSPRMNAMGEILTSPDVDKGKEHEGGAGGDDATGDRMTELSLGESAAAGVGSGREQQSSDGLRDRGSTLQH
jgi:hypothetical protein